MKEWDLQLVSSCPNYKSQKSKYPQGICLYPCPALAALLMSRLTQPASEALWAPPQLAQTKWGQVALEPEWEGQDAVLHTWVRDAWAPAHHIHVTLSCLQRDSVWPTLQHRVHWTGRVVRSVKGVMGHVAAPTVIEGSERRRCCASSDVTNSR